jgi:hypothetical protein
VNLNEKKKERKKERDRERERDRQTYRQRVDMKGCKKIRGTGESASKINKLIKGRGREKKMKE